MEELHDRDSLAMAKDRFYSKTAWAEEPHPILGTKCLLWKASCTTAGYGNYSLSSKTYFAHRDKTIFYAHRSAWVLERGEIHDGLHVLHHCDNPPCVNIDHLFLGTQKDNTLDMLSKGRYVSRPLHGEKHPMGL